LPAQSIKPQKRKCDDHNIKEESAPPDKRKKGAAMISRNGRIYELESELMDIDKTLRHLSSPGKGD
jgi:hypothetical protein